MTARTTTLRRGAGDGDPADVVDAMLRSYVAVLRSRDLEGALALFAEDAMLIGSEPGVAAHDVDGLRRLHTQMFTDSVTYGWEWERPVATRHGDVVWFAAEATWVIEGPGGDTVPYRLSGVLHQDPAKRWLFTLFYGSRPIARGSRGRASI